MNYSSARIPANATPKNAAQASALLAALPADLQHEIQRYFDIAQASPTPFNGLIIMARLARHDDRIAQIVRFLAASMLIHERERQRIETELQKYLPGAITAPTRAGNPAPDAAGGAPVGSVPQQHQPPAAPPAASAPQHTFRCDPEVARLAVVVKHEKYLRFWLVGRFYATENAGPGWLTIDAFKDALAREGLDYSNRNNNHLIALGNGSWWDVDKQTERIYFAGSARMTERLMKSAWRAGEEYAATCGWNLPGRKDIFIPVSRSIKHFRKNILGAWYTYRESPMISREMESALFNREPETLLAWEQVRDEDLTISTDQNYAQIKRPTQDDPDFESRIAAYPEAKPYGQKRTFSVARGYTWKGEKLDWWRLPNRYHAYGARQAKHYGKAYKRQRIAQRVQQQLQPGVEWEGPQGSNGAVTRRAGLPGDRLYWRTKTQLRRWRKACGVTDGWLFVGCNRRGHGIYSYVSGDDLSDQEIMGPKVIARGDRAARYRADDLTAKRTATATSKAK